MKCVQKAYVSRGVNAKLAKFMMKAWRQGTRKNYGCYITKWVAYCSKRKLNCMQPSIGQVLTFLYKCLKGGYAYNTMGMVRYA